MSEGVFLRVRAATTSGALQASACLRLAPFSSLLKAVLSHFWRCGLLGRSATAFGAVCVLPPGGTAKAPVPVFLLPLLLALRLLSPWPLVLVCDVPFAPDTGFEQSGHHVPRRAAPPQRSAPRRLAAEVSPDPRFLFFLSRTLLGAVWAWRPALAWEPLGAGCRAVVGLAPSFSDHGRLWPGGQF